MIDRISKNINKIKRLHPNVFLCRTANEHDVPYLIFNLRTNKYEVHHKFIRKLKDRCDLESYFKTLPFTSAYSLDDTEDQLDSLNKFILTAIDKYGPLVRTEFTKPPALWMKDVKVDRLRHKRYHR